MIAVDYEQGKKIIEKNTCGCGAPLTLAWGGAYGYDSYVVRCTKDEKHDTLARPAELGVYEIPGFNLFNLKGRQKEMAEKLGEAKADALAKYVGQATLQKVELKDIIEKIWPKAPLGDKAKAVMLCATYGLNPLNNHIFLIPYNKGKENETWVLVMSIHSKRLLASRRGAFSYMDNTPRVMTDDEQRSVFGEVDSKRLYAITKLRDPKTSAESVGYGFWPRDDKVIGADKGNTAFNMAAIRSESQALDRLRPGEMPLGIEAIEESTIEAEYAAVDAEGDGGTGGGQKKKEEPVASVSPSPAAEKEGFGVDMNQLRANLKTIKWSEDTAKTYLVYQYKVHAADTLQDTLTQLNKQQAEEFVTFIQEKAAKQQLTLFE